VPQLKIVAPGDRSAAGARIGWGGILSSERLGIFRSQDDRGLLSDIDGTLVIAMRCMPRLAQGV
jgi:hypothetical protein